MYSNGGRRYTYKKKGLMNHYAFENVNVRNRHWKAKKKKKKRKKKKKKH